MPGLIFAKPLNEMTTPAEAGDNDYATWSTASTVRCDLDSGSFDHLFLMMSGVTSYIVSVDGTALPVRTVPKYLTGVSELGNVSIVRHGYQHDLYELPDVLYYRRQVALQAGNTAPHGATQVGDVYWVASNNDDNVYVYNAAWVYQERFGLPSGNTQPRGMAYHTKRNLVISVDNSRKLFLINPETRTLVSQHTLQHNTEGVLYFQEIDEIWVISRVNHRITRYRGTDVSYIGSFSLDALNGDARGGCYLSRKKRAAVLNGADKALYLYDTTGTMTETIALKSTQQTIRAVMETETGIDTLDNGNDAAWVYEFNRGDSLTIDFTGTNIRVNEVRVLRKLIEMTQLAEVAHTKVDVEAELTLDWTGYAETDIFMGEDRLRWQSTVSLDFPYKDTNFEPFIDLIEDNDEIVFAQEPDRKPHRVYEAVFPQDRYDAPYVCEGGHGGNVVSFEIAESRPVSSLWYDLAKFNPSSSGEGLMFFRNCAHLGENGAVDDNDYTTFSTDTTYTLDVDGVSHLFVKATGTLTGIAVQTLVSNTWTTQETITPVQKAYRGFSHSLTQLTTRRTEDQIRLVFTGSDVKIYELMALDVAGEILTDVGSPLGKQARRQVVRHLATGALQRTRSSRRGRLKWFSEIRATFGVQDDFDVEDCLDWINANPNFVFAYKPNETPHRCYPATWQDAQFQQAFVTKILQAGDFLQMNVIER